MNFTNLVICNRHTIWEGINISSGRCQEGIGFITFLEAGYRSKVTGTTFLSYLGTPPNPRFSGADSGSVMHSDLRWLATKCYHGGWYLEPSVPGVVVVVMFYSTSKDCQETGEDSSGGGR